MTRCDLCVNVCEMHANTDAHTVSNPVPEYSAIARCAEPSGSANRAQIETIFGTSRWPDDAHARVPSTAASGMARPCRLDGVTHAHRLRDPIQVRCKTRNALKLGRYLCAALLVNLRRLARRTDTLDQVSRGLCPMAATHLALTFAEHLFEVEPSL